MHRVGSTGNTANSTRPRKERRITYVLRDSNDSKHCSGINCITGPNGLKGANEGEYLFSGSRDGTLKRWELGAGEAVCGATFESHVDWVNDVVVTGDDTLVSCSSDTTLKTWKPFSDGKCTRTFRQHSDYVTSLAACSLNNVVASGGLGREVFIWDLEAAMVPVIRAHNEATEEGSFEAGYASGDRAITSNNLVTAAPPQNPPQGYAPVPAKGHKESVYALAMNDAGTILVSGGTEKAVRVWDPRTGAKQMKLKGHTDNVRALLLDPSGRLCLSGSSDSMIRLWDLGQQRCIHSYAVHTDSVWALASTPSFSHVYSGGRDFSVYLTDLNTRESTLLCKEEHPVLRLALQGDEWLWVATTDSSLHKWPARERSVTKALQRASSFVAGSLPFARARANIDGSAPVPLYTQPTSVIPGTAGIVQHAILNDRRHVLTKDAAGIVKRWEITRGAVIEDYGKVNFEEKEKELFEMVSVPAWFTMDTRLGSMSVHLDTPQCFSAEMYAVDLNVPNASEELKLNIGQETLKGLFAHWLSQRRASTNKALTPTQVSPNGDVSPSLSSGAGDLGSNRRTGLDDAQHEANPQQLLVSPAFEFSTESPPSIITEGSHGGPWRKKATELNGTEDENKLPWWCIECVLHGRLSQRENANIPTPYIGPTPTLPLPTTDVEIRIDSDTSLVRMYHPRPSITIRKVSLSTNFVLAVREKCSFYLHPQQGQTITVLTQGKLSAPRILRIHKVKNYVLEKLILERPLEETGPESNASAGQSGNQQGGGNSNGKGAFRPGTRPWPQGTKPVVEILCNDQVLPPEMSLATVRTYVWKKPEDLYLHYRTVTTPSSSSSR